MKKHYLFHIFVCIFLSGCLTTQPSKSGLKLYKEEGKYVHQGSGLSLPLVVVPTWKSNNTKQYDEDGNDVSVGYYLDGEEKYKKAVATVYVYPALREYAITPIPKFGSTPEKFINDHFEEIKGSIIERNHSVLINEEVIYVGGPLEKLKGRKATLKYKALNGENVIDYAYLFVKNGWFVSFRFTSPEKYSNEVEPKILQLIQGIISINS